LKTNLKILKSAQPQLAVKTINESKSQLNLSRSQIISQLIENGRSLSTRIQEFATFTQEKLEKINQKQTPQKPKDDRLTQFE